jgi:hypothetical protein
MVARTAIALNNLTPAPIRRFVHMQHGTWQIRSDYDPANAAFLTAPVLDRVLPGLLGRFPYPQDAIFRDTSKRTTTAADLQTVIDAEKAVVAEEDQDTLRQRTVSTVTQHTVEEEVDEDGDDEELVDVDDAEPEVEEEWSDND